MMPVRIFYIEALFAYNKIDVKIHSYGMVPTPQNQSVEQSSLARRTLSRKEFLETFQYSQGSQPLQIAVLQYIKNLHPELCMSDADKQELYNQCLKPAEAIRSNPTRHLRVSEVAAQALRSVLAEASDVLNDDAARLGGTIIITRLARGIVERDMYYLVDKKGREYAYSQFDVTSPFNDPWRSDLCWFGLLGNPTGLADMDCMFADVAHYWTNLERTSSGNLAQITQLAELHTLIKIFNVHHPDSLITWPQQSMIESEF